ncbi:amino acid adenylation domain-containing protein [Arboricoccus pini]|uniref:amino acid adenylation domain-containing protein n=1 Tax=Arboricoccus pini TaxID=1963835 RepID=UPI0013FD3EB1|nr:amino acid adenylation domain-containing protein [Arboricoccus pini]
MASAFPSRVAIDDGGVEVSYGALESRSDALAHRLRLLGVGPDRVVGVVLRRRPEMVAVLLAIWKAGGAYAPLDPEAPAERLAGMVADCGAVLVVSERELASRLPADVDLLLIDGGEDVFAAPVQAARPAPGPVHADQLAYVIFTSGTTGRPKGVGVTHGALSMHIEAIGALYGMGEADRVLHVIAWSFDGATECWAAALAHGGRLVLGDPKAWTAEDALAEIRRSGTTIVGMSPALLETLAEAHSRSGSGPLPVRSWTAGGEAFGIEAFARVRQAFWPARIINGYGPTETVITPLLLAVTSSTPASAWEGASWLPIGRPVGARTAHVLDESLGEVGIGVEGELHIGGLGLARGYVGLPGLTAERFVPDPFGPPGGRLYRTGDRVRRRADGSLDYLGRLDQQLKIRGFRIEAGEVEAHLLAHPRCREAAVVAASREGQAHLVAYVAGEAKPEELSAHLAGRLPEPMRPSLIVQLPSLPRLASGKLDRRALPAPTWTARAYAAPETKTEQRLAALMGELLGHARVGRHDGFFQLGGHSLLAAKLVAQIRKEWGSPIGLAELYSVATLAELGALIDRHDESGTTADIDALLAQWEES